MKKVRCTTFEGKFVSIKAWRVTKQKLKMLAMHYDCSIAAALDRSVSEAMNRAVARQLKQGLTTPVPILAPGLGSKPTE